MAIAISIPRLGWNMDEGVFSGWLKQDGEVVRAGDRVFTLEGEKATEEIESLDQGILRIDPAGPKAGDTVAVGVVIGYLTEAGEEAPFGKGGDGASPDPTLPPSPPVGNGRGEGSESPTAQPQSEPGSSRPTARTLPHEGGGGKNALLDQPKSSPRARRVARELGVEWQNIRGTGTSGRIRERDVRAAATAQTGSAVTSVRKAIAERMLASAHATAPVTLTTTVDASNLVNLRNQFRAVAQTRDEVVPGYTDFVVKLAAIALQRHAALCARWENGTLVPAQRLDIGIAVDTEAGLLVPVLRDVPAQSLRTVAAQARDLAERARRGALNGSEMRGGVFTVTNLGAFGIDAFTPIINTPECAILGMGRIQRRPVAVDDQVAIRDQMVLSLTFDHRIVDGAPAARFLQSLVQLLENPGPWLMP
ncbi:MAG: dihydrolipoamide acetyltransferase family protein [Isosphaeraceae bacterium]|nr:dihydrolipoamide acetyltransferase family protein [Isosphaeraceae bacterium]